MAENDDVNMDENKAQRELVDPQNPPVLSAADRLRQAQQRVAQQPAAQAAFPALNAPAAAANQPAFAPQDDVPGLVPRRVRKRRRTAAGIAIDDEPEQKQGINPFEPLRQLAGRVKSLITRANDLLGEMNAAPANADAQAIYGQLQKSKQQLIEQIDKLVQLRATLVQVQQDADEYEQKIGQNILVDPQELNAFSEAFDTDFNLLEQAVDTLETQMRQQVQQAQAIRVQFQVPEEMTEQKDFDNYYGVYIYNVLINACKQVLQTLNVVPPAVPGIYNAGELFSAIIDNEVALETRKQVIYLQSITDLQNNIQQKGLQAEYKTQLEQWEVEKIAVNQRLSVNNGTLLRCKTLAMEEVKRNQALQIEADKQVGYWQPFEQSLILTGVAGTRMFENDILPEQKREQPDVKKEYSKEFNELSVETKNAWGKRAVEDIQWRETSILEKQRYLQVASGWAIEAGYPVASIEEESPAPDVFARLLEGLLDHLGLRVMKVGDDALKSISLAWNDNEIYAAMQDSCKDKPEQKVQFVLETKAWEEVLEMMRGTRPLAQLGGEDVIFFVLIGNPPENKYFGLLQVRNSQKVRNSQNVFELQDILGGLKLYGNNPWKSGVPQPNAEEKSLEITFLCTQRSRPGYLLRGKPPTVGLGVLLMLYAFWWCYRKDYVSTMLEVVGTVDEKEQEGVSNPPSNSRIAAFYQRQFKYQRTSALNNFSVTPALGYFHPDWQTYVYTRKRRGPLQEQSVPKPLLQIMYRPYPTLPDLADILARLVRDVQEHYG
jgi:hypothetical protein